MLLNETPILDKILFQSVVVAFGILQVVLVAAVGAAFKLWCDVQQLKRDMNAAHKMIRALRNGERDEDDAA